MMSDGLIEMVEVGEEGTKSVCLALPDNPLAVVAEGEEAGNSGTPIRSYLAHLKDSAIALLQPDVVLEEEAPSEDNYPW